MFKEQYVQKKRDMALNKKTRKVLFMSMLLVLYWWHMYIRQLRTKEATHYTLHVALQPIYSTDCTAYAVLCIYMYWYV